MCDRLQDAENRTPLFAAPQNGENPPRAAAATGAEAAKPLPSPFSHAADKWALPAALWAGYLYCLALFAPNDFRWPYHICIGGENGLWLYCMPLMLCAVFCTGVTVWCRLRRIRGAAESPLWLGCLLTVAAAMGFDRLNAAGWALGWLAFHGFAVVWALARTGQLTGGRTGPAFVPDVLRGIGRGFAGLAAWPRDVWAFFAGLPRRPRRKSGHTVPALLCIGAALVRLMLAAKQLARADDLFADQLQQLVESLIFWKELSVEPAVVFSLIFMFPVGAFFYGMTVAGHRALDEHPRPAVSVYAEALAPARQVPVGLLCGVLAAFAVLYFAFFGVQSGYFLGAFTGKLPEGFTVANYARQGFFELCRVVLLNFILLAAAEIFALKPLHGCRPLQGASAVILIQSILLWGTAASKLGLYISVFGFTAKRLLAAWALLVLAVALCRWLRRVWVRCSVLRPCLLAGAVSFALLCLY